MHRSRVYAVLLAVPVAWLVVRINVTGVAKVPMAELPALDLATLAVGIPAAVGLWVWMLGHFWRHPPSRFRMFWTLALVLGLHIGALAYCLLVYVRADDGSAGPVRR